MHVIRHDMAAMRPPRKMANGWLRVDAYPTKTGVFLYRNPDGSERRELRLPDEVFRGDVMETMAGVPLTNEHPPVMLDSSNTKEYAVGHAGDNIRRDGDFVRASLFITDAKVIAEMEGGKKQLSCGYACEVVDQKGEWMGQKYDGIQRNITYNHVAIVATGRAGPEACARMDSAVMVLPIPQPTEEKKMKIRIDGKEFEVADDIQAAVSAEHKAHETAMAGAGKAKDEALAQRDVEKIRADKAEQALVEANSPEKLRAAVKSRVALEVEAAKHLGEGVKLDAMSDREVKVAVIAKATPEFKSDGKSDDYVQARYDATIEQVSRVNPALAAARIASTTHRDDSVDNANDETAARKRMIEANQNRWKTPSA